MSAPLSAALALDGFYDDLTLLATLVCAAPIAVISLVDGQRLGFKSVRGLDADQALGDDALFGFAAVHRRLSVIDDTLADARVRTSPLVTGREGIRFYAAAPIVSANGTVLGTIAVLDRRARGLDAAQRLGLEALARQVLQRTLARGHAPAGGAAAMELDVALRTLRAQAGLLSTLSHELRTPLSSVIGFSSLLLRDPSSLTDEQRRHVERIAANGRQLLTLVDDALDLARIESGRSEPRLQSVALLPLLRKVLEELDGIARSTGTSLRLNAAQPAHPVWADPLWLERILVNLVGNAVKHARGAAVEVALQVDVERGAPLRIDVIDNGPGLPPERLGQIFEPFQQLAGGRGGAGLGLTISRALAAQLGMALMADSVPGQGATFSLLLDPAAPLPRHLGVRSA